MPRRDPLATCGNDSALLASITPFLVGLPFSVYFGFLVGFASHLFIDALTPAGIMPLQPLLSFRVRGFVKTGSLLELFFFMGVVMLIILDVYYKAMHLIAVL